MTQLYSTLADIYHEMYQHVFDYDREFEFYDTILKKYEAHTILEIGCGSGMLARRFMKNGYDYSGMDLFNEMLEIARQETGSDRFIQGDMRNLSYSKQFEAILITGRSIAYVPENRGVLNTFTGIHQSLKDDGYLIFDCFEATGIFDNMSDFEQDITHNGKRIQRKSKLQANLETGFTWDWQAKYIISEASGKVLEFDDLTTLRAFTKDEILLFLKLTDFSVKEIIEDNKAMTLIAQKTKS